MSVALVILGGTGLVIVGSMSISLGIRILIRDVLKSRPHPFISVHKETKAYDGETVTRNNSTLSLKN